MPEQTGPSISETATADDVFGALGSQEPTDDNSNVLSLSQPPKWLRRPVSATFGYGGLLTSVSNSTDALGKKQSSVHLRSIITEQSILDRAEALNQAGGDKDKLAELCSNKVEEDAAWKTLFTLFKADSRDELIHMLGFSKEDVVKQVQEAIKQFPADRVPTVTFAEPEADTESEAKADDEVSTPKEAEPKLDSTPSEVSLTSDTTKRTEATEVTEQSLFDDETGTPAAAGADFFSSMTSGSLRNPLIDGIVPRHEVAASSVAATVGSRASSVRSETVKENNFRIYPSGESNVDRLVTQALVLGDFKSAVDLCLASERFADALLLAVRGGPELLASTQKAYFARRTTSLPFLRVFQSIVTEDLADIVQNADLAEWKVVFVVLCTFAKDVDFNNLAEQLGQRLQFRSQVFSNSDSPEAQASAKEARGDATLCYLAARRLEKVVSIWIDEMREEESASASSDLTRYSAHAHALQSFIEKVAVFTAATGYRDDDLAHPTESAVAAETGARSYRLAGLYDRFYEYADLLATQGSVDMAAKYAQMTPSDYKGTGAAGFELDKARDRLFRAAGIAEGSVQTNAAFSKAAAVASGSSASTPAARSVPAAQASPYGAPSAYQSTGYAPAPTQQAAAPVSVPATGTGNNPYAPANYGGYPDQSAYAPAQPQQQQQSSYQPSYGQTNGYPGDPQPQGYGVPGGGSGYAPNQSQQIYNQPQGQSQYGAPPTQSSLAPPPRANQAASTPPPVPAAQRRDMPGWNDAPNFAAPPKRPQSAAKDHKPAPIMSPFPMSTDPMAQAGAYAGGGGGGQSMPPQGPPRAPSRGVGTPGVLPPPPKAGPRTPSAQQVARQAMPTPPQQQQARPTPPPQAQARPPPPRGGPPPGTFAGPPPPGPGGMAGGPPPRALSPLGPGRVAQQPPPISGQFRPTPPPAQGGPRPDGLSPPTMSQSRMGGPPPPGPGRGGPPPIAPTRSTPSPKPQTPAPAKQAHRKLHIATNETWIQLMY
jgi:protein transport protein SEC31